MRSLLIAALLGTLLALAAPAASQKTPAKSPPPKAKVAPPPKASASPPPKKAKSPPPPPPPSPPPQGMAPPGAPVFLESAQAKAPAGYRAALVADAIIAGPAIFKAIKNGVDGCALEDGWINGEDYGYQIFSSLNPSLKTGPFMYTSLKAPQGPEFLVLYKNSTTNTTDVPYGYRLANCAESRDANTAIAGWKNGTVSHCDGQQGYVTSPPKFGGNVTVSCAPPAKNLNITLGVCGVYTRIGGSGCQYMTGYTLFPGYDVNGSTFDPQTRFVGDVEAIGPVCNNRVKCKAFNVDGQLKSVLPVFGKLVKKYANQTCAGLYAPTLRAGCGLPNFTFYWSYDSPGGDYTKVKGDAKAIAKACLADSNCKGFTTSGTTKQAIQDRSQWTQWTTARCEGLYVRTSK